MVPGLMHSTHPLINTKLKRERPFASGASRLCVHGWQEDRPSCEIIAGNPQAWKGIGRNLSGGIAEGIAQVLWFGPCVSLQDLLALLRAISHLLLLCMLAIARHRRRIRACAGQTTRLAQHAHSGDGAIDWQQCQVSSTFEHHSTRPSNPPTQPPDRSTDAADRPTDVSVH